jgi:hypothetical protein
MMDEPALIDFAPEKLVSLISTAKTSNWQTPRPCHVADANLIERENKSGAPWRSPCPFA